MTPNSATAPRPTPPLRHSRRLLAPDAWLTALIGFVVFAVAYDNGGYGLSSRSIVGIGIWWAIILGVGLGLLSLGRPPRQALVTGGLLAGFTGWTLASTSWAPSAENAFNEFNRASLYLAIFTLVVAAGTRGNVGRWADGLALGIVATAFVSLASRLFPHLFSTRGLATFLPSAQTRLSFPVGYWNGLAILMGIAFPLCFRGAIAGQNPLTRGLALLPVPALAAVIYLTSSRGGTASALAGTLVFLAATGRRWSAVGALLTAGIGSGLAVAVLLHRHELVNGPIGSAAAASEGRSAAVLIAGCCLVGSLLFLAGERALTGRFRPNPVIGRVLAAAVALAAVGAIVLAHPVRRFEDFKQPLAAAQSDSADFVRSHLLSGNGSGRWQFWASAVDEFKTDPVVGRGAGSYESWWAQHASFTYFLRNAHSLYLEVLGELGIVGLLLLGGAFLTGLGSAIRRISSARGEERATVAALTAAFVAFAVGAAIDWVWQLTVVGLVGIACLGLLAGPATATGSWVAVAMRPQGGRTRSLRFATGAAVLVAAWLLICAQAIPWLSGTKISDSQAAVRRGDGSAALMDALDAKSLQPWAASPYLQLALVEEQSGDLPQARRSIAAAIRRNGSDWRLWLVSARLETESGRIPSARRSLERAAALNPRSQLFAGISTGKG
jgi:hypothetical protein